ncbi:MAG: hypothetical protein Unbinned3849contig1000_6 [Prokaryotic dsDNA virus sp.]|nr:MAG: hypothetical protein Unbinned3849contig1000_6 [Prokaryotic dsDNA virus sp.]|tara:strand:+ start:8913 stop:12167 length:3255 start_codon:yes stop_codon:yes gene_type:complete
MSSCDKTKKHVTQIELFDLAKEEMSEKDIRDLGGDKNELDSIANDILKTDKPVNEVTLNEVLNKRYGRHAEGEKISKKILMLVNSNPSIKKLVQEEMVLRLPKDKSRIKHSSKGVPLLSSLPISSLKVIYRNALSMSRAGVGQNWGRGLVGSLNIELRTPKELGKMEQTGAVYEMVDTMQRLSERIGSSINDYMFKPKGKTKSGRNYGMHDVYQQVKDLDRFLLRSNITDKRSKLVRLFTMLSNNWITYGKDGQLYIHKDYGPTGDKYQSTGDPVYAFKNPVLLKDYAPPGKEKGHYYIPMTDEMNKGMQDAINKSDAVNKDVVEFIKKEMPRSVEAIIKSLSKGLPSLSGKEIKEMFYSEDHEKTVQYQSLSKEEKRLVDKLYSIFQGMTMIEPVIFEATLFKEKKNYFPVMYEKMSFPLLWDDMLVRKEQEINEINNAMETAVGLDRIELKKKLKEARSVIKRGTFIRDRMDEYPQDIMNDVTMPIAKDIKHIEHITNAIDIRNMRTDDGVYYTYLKNIVTAVERNLATASLIENYIKAKSDGAREYIEGIYKVPFNRPDTPASFLGLDYSTDSIVSKLNNVGINISPESYMRKMRTSASWLTARYLGGIGTTIQNYLALNQNLIDYGMEAMSDSWTEYRGDNNKHWKDLINKSGIVEFQDFFSKSLINEMAATELGTQTYLTIIGAYLNFYIERKKAKTSKQQLQAVTNLEENISKALSESDLFITDPKGLPTEKRLKDRLKITRSKRLGNIMKKYVNYAINYEYEMNKSIKGMKLKTVPYKVLGRLAKAWGEVRKERGFTMGDTEAFIRSISFVIGVREAQKMGHLPLGNPWEFTGDTLQKAIEIGRSYSRYTNFGLSTQDVGQFNWGSMGNMMGKFKFWSEQKFGRDQRIIKDAYRSFKSLKNIENDNFDLAAVGKVFKSLFNKKLRDTNPDAAKLRTFLMTQGVATILFDMFLSPVAFIPHLRSYSYRYMPSGKYVRGVTSDYLSMMLMPLTLALKGLFYDDDDEENAMERSFTYYLRKTMFGFAPNWAFENILLFLGMGLENNKMIKNKVTSIASPFTPTTSSQLLLRKSLDEIAPD